ncbi:MAG: phosphotransferase [bacterium]
MTLEACLPLDLQGRSATITRFAAGLSTAGVYRVEVADQTFALKIASDSEPLTEWQRKLSIQQAAATAGLAPRIIHTNELRRAVLSAFVVDRSFPAFFMNPATRESAIVQLGRMLRRVHALPLASNAVGSDPVDVLRSLWLLLEPMFAVPAFVRDAIQRMLAEEAPVRDRALVVSHNDVNPSNLIYDGENLLLVDWDAASPNDPFYDLATISVFARMDDATCARMLTAYDGAPVVELPARFTYNRRLMAIFGGTMLLRVASFSGHGGASGDETLESTLSLGEFYQRMQAGAVDVATAEGQWLFGLALVKTGTSLPRDR